MDHVVYNTFISRYSIDVIIKARKYNPTETSRAIDVYQTAWDNNESFTITDAYFIPVLTQRPDNTAEELNACVDQLYSVLVGIIRTGWISHLEKDDAIALYRILGFDHEISVHGIESFSADNILTAWNINHPDDQIYFDID